MITVIPRAIPMISATPRSSRAPLTKESVSLVSDIRPMIPIRIENRMNSAVISGNHHHGVGTPTPMSSHEMTPYIISRNARPKTPRMVFCRPVMDASAAWSVLTLKWASFASFMPCTNDREGSRRTRSAYGCSRREGSAERTAATTWQR